MVLALILSVITMACSAETPGYLQDGMKVDKNNADANPAQGSNTVSVVFDQGSLPASVTVVNSLNVYVSTQSGATQYRYALLSGPAASAGASSCASATYNKFVKLTVPIIVSDLVEGTHLLCARGKNAAGISQETATTYSWKVDPNAPDGQVEEAPVEPTEDENPPINVVVNVPVNVTNPQNTQLQNTQPQDTSQTEPTPEPQSTPQPQPTPMMEVKKGTSTSLAHAFNHGETTTASYSVHNVSSDSLDWRVELDTSDADWLQAEYDGNTKKGNNINFNGNLAANSTSKEIKISLALTNNMVDLKYLAMREEGNRLVGTDQHVAQLLFTNENTGSSEQHSAFVYLYIPRLYLQDSPARKHLWELPIQHGDNSVKKIYIRKGGLGSLTWESAGSSYNSGKFQVSADSQIDGGHIGINANGNSAVGDHAHVGIVSNSGANSLDQTNPSRVYIYVCVVSNSVDADTACPEHDPNHQ